MKKTFVTLVSICCILLLCSLRNFALSEEIPWNLSSEVGKIANKMLELFPKVEVYVIAIDGEKVVLDNSKGGLSEGMALNVFKKGKEYTHPVTGEVLGHTEEEVAKIKVVSVQDSLAVGMVIKKTSKIERGQKARITSARLRLVFPDIKNSLTRSYETDDLHSQMVTALEKNGRFDIIPMIDIYYAMNKHNVKDMSKMLEHDFADKVAQDLKSDILLECDIRQIGKVKFIEYKISIPGFATILSRNSIRIKDDGYAKPVEKKMYAQEPRIEYGNKGIVLPDASRRSQKFDYVIVSMQIGDVDGDGKFDVVTTDGKKVRVYNKTQKGLKLLWEEQESHSKQISVDLVDLNGNGVDEIYVTRFRNTPKSYGVEYRDGKFTTFMDGFPRFLRVIINGDKRALFGQKMSGISVFHKGLEKYAQKDLKLSAIDEIPTPSGVSLYGTALGAVFGEKVEQVITYSISNYLQVYNLGGEKVWESPERYGGTTIRIDVAAKNKSLIDDRYGLLTESGGKGKTWIKPRLLIADTDGNGSSEVILYKNVSMSGDIVPNSPIFDKSSIMGLEYNGIGLSRKWFTNEIDATTADIDLQSMGDGSYVLAAALVLRKANILSFSSRKSMIVFYDIGKR